MCAKCVELDGKIARYRELRMRLADQLRDVGAVGHYACVAIDGITGLIQKLVDEKAASIPQPRDRLVQREARADPDLRGLAGWWRRLFRTQTMNHQIRQGGEPCGRRQSRAAGDRQGAGAEKAAPEAS
jgi:hypothetical protein